MRARHRERALIIVDMQKDFVCPDGKLAVPGAMTIVKTINELRQKAYENGIRVIYTQDWHDRNDVEFQTWPAHCVENTEGAEIVSELTPYENDIVVRKQQLSAFANMNKDACNALDGIHLIYVTGVALDYCVKEFALGVLMQKVKVVVDAVRGVDEIPNTPRTKGKIIYEAMEMGNFGVKPVYAEDALREFDDNKSGKTDKTQSECEKPQSD